MTIEEAERAMAEELLVVLNQDYEEIPKGKLGRIAKIHKDYSELAFSINALTPNPETPNPFYVFARRVDIFE